MDTRAEEETKTLIAEKPKPEDVVGGQAVLDGIMMRRGNNIAVAVRKPDGRIEIKEQSYVSLCKRYKVLGFVFIRGFITLVEMMIIGMKTMTFSAEVSLTEGEKKPQGWWTFFSVVIGLGIGLTLFVVVPAFVFTILREAVSNVLLLNLLEGMIRLSIFLCFIFSTLLLADMRNVYMYHGAEHKTVFAWEDGRELTVENIRPYSTRHPRCGTSFLLIVMVTAILVFSLLGKPEFLDRVLYKILLFPIIAGISYEVIRFTGKHRDRRWVQVVSWPGLLLQKITTREPSDEQIEVAILAMKKVV